MDINTFYKNTGNCDGVLRGIMCSHPSDVVKSDGFILVLDRKILLIDGGSRNCRTTAEMLGRLHSVIAPHGQLNITWILTHYHYSHATETLDFIIPDSRFAFESVFLPPVPKKCTAAGSEAADLRMRIIAALTEYNPKVTINSMHFADNGGFRDVIDHAGSRVVIMPPESDWSGETGDASSVVNNSCAWVRLSYAGRRLLYAGDSMNYAGNGIKNFDAMLEKWNEFLTKIDFIAWPNHGENRDFAAEKLLKMKPKYILTSTQNETASAYVAQNFPEESKKIKFYNCALSDVLFEIAPDGEMIFND